MNVSIQGYRTQVKYWRSRTHHIKGDPRVAELSSEDPITCMMMMMRVVGMCMIKKIEEESVHPDYWPGRKRCFYPNNSGIETAEGDIRWWWLVVINDCHFRTWPLATFTQWNISILSGALIFLFLKISWKFYKLLVKFLIFICSEKVICDLFLDLSLFVKMEIEGEIFFEFLFRVPIDRTSAIPGVGINGGC